MSNSVILKNLEANAFVHQAMWVKDQGSYVAFAIFDSIITSDAGIIGWIFAASDGFIKSKSKGRWNAAGIMDRCAPMESQNNLQAHYTHDGRTWNILSKDIILHLIGYPTLAHLAIFGHIPSIGKTLKYLEQSYENIAGKNIPKYSSFMLCGSLAKGVSTKDTVLNIIPTQRVTCLSKDICDLGKSSINDLVKIIEGRSRIRVSKVTAVFVVDNESSGPASLGQTNQKLWYHHTTEISYETFYRASSLIEDSTPRQSALEKRSVTCSTVTEGGGSFMRLSKCVGDFCPYSEDEEVKNMELMDGPSDVKREARNARRRHRRLTDDDADDIEDMLASKEEDEREELSGNSLPAKSLACKVPYMSIVLARKEMAELEAEASHASDVGDAVQSRHAVWPDVLTHWWSRMGRSIALRKGVKAVPSSSAHSISAALLAAGGHNSDLTTIVEGDVASTAGTAEAGDDGGNPMQAGFHMGPRRNRRRQSNFTSTSSVQSSSARSHTSARCGESSDVSTVGDDSIPFDLSENSYSGQTRRNAGQLSWYYSNARVCAKCYAVYRDLDRRRKKFNDSLLRERRRQKEEEDLKTEKEVDRKIFMQRKFVSRISELEKPPRQKLIKGSVMENSVAANEGSQWSQSGGGPQQQDGYRGSHKSLLVGAPKGVLPPLPWQLDDKDQREKYEKIGSSFIRNIRSKAQETAAVAFQERMMNKYKNQYEQEQNGADWNPDYEWNVATGVQQHCEQQVRPRDAEIARPRRQGKAKQSQRQKQQQQQRGYAQFDPDRLLHPWQREMHRIRREQNSELSHNMAQQFQQKQLYVENDDNGVVEDGAVDSAYPFKGAVVKNSRNSGVAKKASKMTLPAIGKHTGASGSTYAGQRSQSMPSLQQASLISQLTGTTLEPSLYDPPPSVVSAFRPDDDNDDDDDAYYYRSGANGVNDAHRGGLKSALKGGKGINERDAASLQEDEVSMSELSQRLRRSVSFTSLGGTGGIPQGTSRPPTHPVKSTHQTTNSMRSSPAPSPSKNSSSPHKGFGISGGFHSHQNSRGRVVEKEDVSDDGDDDDDDDDEEIGWSPFVIPSQG